MNIQREFLGFAQPGLSAAADFLIRRYARGRVADMGPAIAVLPGARAGRRLLEVLVDAAEAQSLILTPPQIVTVGRLPESLYRPKKPFATDLVQQLAWSQALQNTPAAVLRSFVAHPPGKDDAFHWLELGRLLSRQHAELAADGRAFGDVAERGRALETFAERPRWEAMRQVQDAYLRRLDELGLWDIQTARLEAIKREECATDHDIVLIGAVDMTVTLRHMLDRVAARVTALVLAPREWADRFDEHGCLRPEVWQAITIPLDEDRVHLVDDPAEQADEAARRLAAYGGKYRPEEISIGLADEAITPHLQRQLRECGLASHSAAGVPLPSTAPYRLLDAAADFLGADRYGHFSALVRHPDVYDWIERRRPNTGWLERLDAYHNEHLQSRFGDRWLGARESHATVRAVYGLVQRWLKPLGGKPQPLDQWSQPIRELLLEIYRAREWSRELPPDRVCLGAFEQIDGVLAEHAQRIPAALMPQVSAADAIRLTLEQLRSAAVSLPLEPAAIELLGWLELPLDDAPALVVCSFNEGHVPSSINSDMFLPNALRSRLGLQDNDRRYARDAYALSVLIATRESVDLIVGRRNADNDPMPPSRLLFATDAETVARRALRFFRPPPPRHGLPPLAGGLTAARPMPDFPVPRPAPLAQPVTELAVTAFRDYLACPYRFYLRRILRLEPVDDAATELDGGAFGSLLHAALRDFGSGPGRDSTDPEEIATALNKALDRYVAESFGKHPLAAVEVQVEQLRLRLRAFAEKQAAWAAEGWRIEHTEAPDKTQAPAAFTVDGQPLLLRGRVDRIDVRGDEHVILDYKSSDSGDRPEKTHQRGGEWTDLQLPLYRHLVHTLGIDGPVRLGYVLLPKDVAGIEFCLAEWTDADLKSADQVACQVVRDIRAERFWPPTDPPPDYSESLAPICQDGVFDRGG